MILENNKKFVKKKKKKTLTPQLRCHRKKEKRKLKQCRILIKF